MPSIVAESALAANLASLGGLNADLAEKLAGAEPPGDVTFADTAQGVPTAMVGSTALCSRHRPLDEADRLIESIDLVEHAVVVVFGFGLGYHVQRLAERLNKAGIIVVFEPDVALLRTVLSQVDHSRWLRNALVVWITDPTDRGALAQKLKGTEPILAQGVAFLEHPASRSRLAEQSRQFATMFKDFVSSAKTTLVTTLMRSVDTVRNLLLNLDHYTVGPGIGELRDAAQGYPAVVVSAGPSLRRNVHLLAQPGVRDRCVIVAVQTTLKPLLEAGIAPHFVTALDYHEISRRFYEALDPAAVGDVVLVADPKANPVILDAFPGPVCCCASDFLDGLFGDLRRDMGRVPPGATVSHLAVYLARFLGCNPIALIGQDLGFTDGLYYAPGTAIADVWAPELNPFNTMPMMEWQRIARHRLHLQKTQDVHGRSICTDAQMLTYLHQFERDFEQYAREGVEIIDATEGGVVKQHTRPMPLVEVLDRYANRPLPALPVPQPNRDPKRSDAVRGRIAAVRRDVAALRETSRKTVGLIRQMLEDQHDAARMEKHFKRIEQYRREVEQRFGAFEILNHLNQLGGFKRMKADRRLHMQGDLDPLSHQRGQLERDLDNVNWIADAAQEMVDQLADAERLLSGERVSARPKPARRWIEEESKATAAPARIAALVPIDPQQCGLGVRRDLTAPFAGKPVLQATLERLGRSEQIESIILIAPESLDIDAMIDRSTIGRQVIVERCDGSPYGVEHEAVAAARYWSDTSWRGGIAGMSVYDEVLCPQVMHPILERLGLSAALLVGPDWPLVDVSTDHGCDAVVARYRDHPERHNLVFTQAPPGMGGCLISASLMQELAQRNRLSIIGGLLVYQPHAPQHDPIAREANVQIHHQVRRSLIRATFDSPRWQRRLRQAVEPIYAGGDLSSAAAVAAIEQY
ncbi:MAG: motility associated factor glycosyltransferase family protein, partial [Planctomycetota bacterium]